MKHQLCTTKQICVRHSGYADQGIDSQGNTIIVAHTDTEYSVSSLVVLRMFDSRLAQ